MELSNSTVKTPEPETEGPIPARIQLPAKPPPPFTNGVLKRHAPPQSLHPPALVTYRECLRNHAAALGGHALDGCGEFMPSPASNPADPTSLRCAACGCHRNFHRRDPEETTAAPTPPPLLLPAPPALEFRPHHRHHPPPPPPPGGASPDDSPSSPPPISSAYAPHMLLALSHPHETSPAAAPPPFSSGRKRFRTKFTHGQKEKMLELAERVGWKMQKRDEDLINGFCGSIGVDKGVFKVWMHNNKNNFGKKDAATTPPAANGGANAAATEEEDSKENVRNDSAQILGTNGSSSSS